MQDPFSSKISRQSLFVVEYSVFILASYFFPPWVLFFATVDDDGKEERRKKKEEKKVEIYMSENKFFLSFFVLFICYLDETD